jgi:hypothetical protein
VITAIDSSIILDVLSGDALHGPASRSALRAVSTAGRLIVCTAVVAEVRAAFDDDAAAGSAFDRMGIEVVPDDREIALAAGAAWRSYRRAGGTRRRVLADFLIAAHAIARADRLLTRDRGFYRSHFPGLAILDPANGPRNSDV